MKVIQTILYLTVVIHLVLITSGCSIYNCTIFYDDSSLLNCCDDDEEVCQKIGQFNGIFDNTHKHLNKFEMVR